MSYRNPIVRGTAPDPSAIRVGEDYFLASSTFDQLPGVTIRHSTDLVSWRVIGHAVTRPAQYRRDDGTGPMVLFAPTLRHHGGVFYLACTNAIPGQGNFVLRTDDPAGEWSDALWIDDEGFDPSLFRDDDGTWYYTRRTLQFRPDGDLGPIVQATIDLDTGVLGELRPITPPHGFASNDIEGPHLYRRRDWYYLCSAEGGSWHGHMQTVARSRSPWGPFEHAPSTPFLTHRHLTANRVQDVGHAELLEAADGTWWTLSLGVRHPRMAQHHNLGRETFLTPVRWVDDWPVAGTRGDGTTALEVAVSTPEPRPGTRLEVPDTVWNRGWTTIGRAAPDLDAGQGDDAIRLPLGAHPGAARAGVAPAPVGALLRAQTEDDQTFTATLSHVPTDAAGGIAAFADAAHHYALTLEAAADGSRTIVTTRTVDDLVVREEQAAPGDGPVELRIDAHETRYRFEAVVDGAVIQLGAGAARLLSAEAAQWFVGVHWTLLAVGEPGTGAVTFADVSVRDTAAGEAAAPVPF